MAKYHEIGITGANGTVGRVLMKGLAEDYHLRAITRRAVDMASTIVSFDSIDALAEAFHGLEAVIHLGANPSPGASWESILENNIDATHNTFEACRLAGVKRMIFASTNHTMHGHTILTTPETLDPKKQIRLALGDAPNPDSFYAVSKLFGENLGRLYFEKHGIEFVGMRIGWLILKDDPSTKVGTSAEDYMWAMWLSHRDCVEAHRCALEADVGFTNAYVISRNERRVFDLEETERVLGYHPKDNAEDHFK
jgi:nucleoside-diphosphate-sugar epimerase